MSPDSTRQQLMMVGVARMEEIVWPHSVARLQIIQRVSPASPTSPDVFSITALQYNTILKLHCMLVAKKAAYRHITEFNV